MEKHEETKIRHEREERLTVEMECGIAYCPSRMSLELLTQKVVSSASFLTTCCSMNKQENLSCELVQHCQEHLTTHHELRIIPEETKQ